MPTFDWAAFTQRVFAFISRAMLFRLLLGFWEQRLICSKLRCSWEQW